MKFKFNKFFILIIFSNFFIDLNSISLVYNLKVRRAFNVSTVLGENHKSLWLFTALPIFYKRDRHVINKLSNADVFDKRYTIGSLFNVRYISEKHWWLEFTTGLERESGKFRGTSNFKTSRTGIDDIVISGGYNFFPSERTQFVLYGLFGFPTRRKVNLNDALDPFVGTRFFGTAVGWEISYAFIKSLKRSCIGIFQNRFLHLFDRKWYPILPCDAKIQPGNATDLLFILQYREKRNIFELGYNPTFFTNQAVKLKTGTVKSDPFVRQSIYFSYSHICKRILSLKRPVLVGAGVNISHAKLFNAKSYTAWLNISTVF